MKSVHKYLTERLSSVTASCKSNPELPFLAQSYNKLKEIKELIESGACVDSEDTDGETALSVACKSSNANIIMYAISKGANVHHKQNLLSEYANVVEDPEDYITVEEGFRQAGMKQKQIDEAFDKLDISIKFEIQPKKYIEEALGDYYPEGDITYVGGNAEFVKISTNVDYYFDTFVDTAMNRSELVTILEGNKPNRIEWEQVYEDSNLINEDLLELAEAHGFTSKGYLYQYIQDKMPTVAVKLTDMYNDIREEAYKNHITDYLDGTYNEKTQRIETNIHWSDMTSMIGTDDLIAVVIDDIEYQDEYIEQAEEYLKDIHG